MNIATVHGGSTTIDSSLESLLGGFRGALIAPDHPGYEEHCRLYNGMIECQPALIARCADVGDVIAAIRTARKHDLLTSVRGGGHNGAGLALRDGALTIDLSQMRGVRVDPSGDTVRVEGGCVWGDVDHATHAFGRAVPSGIISTTGVAGLTLGGGHGYLTRRYGLTVDSLLEADVVLADGSVVTASADQHSDLFWALRGGGGNFGVVTSFVFRTHPVAKVHAGPMLWRMEDAEEILGWYRHFMPSAPEDLYGFFGFMAVPPSPQFPDELHGHKMCTVLWCSTDTSNGTDTISEAVSYLPSPAFSHVGEMPYPMLQAAFDELYHTGLQWYWKGDFVREISDDAVQVHIEHAARLPTAHSTMHLYPIDGAAHRVASDETAFAHRDASWSMVIAGVDPDPANRRLITDWARSYWQDLHPHTAGGAYVNFMMEEGEERIQATYGANHRRLQEVKGRYDPDNLFRVNQNIRPLGRE